MDTTETIKQKEKELIILKIVEWAQRHKIKVESLTYEQMIEAIKCKF